MDKPLSYDSLKSVLKHMSLKKREAINRQNPALRTISSSVPYVLENVVISNATFETDGRRWFTKSAWLQKSDLPIILVPTRDVVTLEETELTILQGNFSQAQFRVNKSDEEVLEQLFDDYIRNGTVVRGTLCIDGIPQFLKRRRENEGDLKIKVTNLELDIYGTKDYEHFIWFIDLDVLENVKFLAVENSLELLDKPEIQTCKNLTAIVKFGPGFPSVDQLRRLRNQHLYLKYYGFSLHELQLLVEDWITTGREVGTRFTWENHQFELEDVLGILQHLKTHFGAVEAGSNGNSTTLKMREDRELVMFCGKIQSGRDINYLFEMQVVAITPATGIGPT
ncbi:hypothetical protein CRE_17414 [Caenorhabditis remanei]|uniref:F-box associated domain-containing protein n=1 Tax=Caenorhabditis remanei TaxID=31234 RepID=E3N289_CAERE|nr:hypothetical protein CRE_17414 [Caenorhabditis remanei]